MDRIGFASFLSAHGFQIIKAGDELWVEKRRFVLENIPPHRRIHLSRWDAAKVFLRGYAVLQYSCEETEATSSFEFVCEDKEYGMKSLTKNVRWSVRKGLKNCTVRRIDFDLLGEQGCAINCSVFARQGRVGLPVYTEPRLWKAFTAACKAFPEIEPYGALAGGRLCAYLLTVPVDEYVYFYHPFAETESLKLCPMNALVFIVVQTLIQRPEVNRVSYGLEPLDPLPELERFKHSMGFRKRSIGRRLVVNPLALPFLTRPAQRLAQVLFGRGKFRGYLMEFLRFARAFQAERAGSAESKA